MLYMLCEKISLMEASGPSCLLMSIEVKKRVNCCLFTILNLLLKFFNDSFFEGRVSTMESCKVLWIGGVVHWIEFEIIKMGFGLDFKYLHFLLF